MNSNLRSYSSFAPYYRTLLKHRSHAKPIAQLLSDHLTSEHRRLLDAACGQGNSDYFDALPEAVFVGSDGSHDMTDFLNADPTLRARYEAVVLCEWKSLSSLFRRHGKFDAVFFLGNSISHVTNLDEFHQIVLACYEGLNNHGRLILDMRQWRMAGDRSRLFESGRNENEKRLLLTEARGNAVMQIFDSCHYDSDRQMIDYYVEEAGRVVASASFAYLMTRPEEIISTMTSAGFKIQYFGKPDYYPYYAICGEK